MRHRQKAPHMVLRAWFKGEGHTHPAFETADAAVVVRRLAKLAANPRFLLRARAPVGRQGRKCGAHVVVEVEVGRRGGVERRVTVIKPPVAINPWFLGTRAGVVITGAPQ